MKNNNTNNALKRYSGVAASIIAGTSLTNAQVIYTNVDPDETYTTGNSYALDLDNDLTIDFNIDAINLNGTYSGYNIVGDGIRVDALGSNSVMGGIGVVLGQNYRFVDTIDLNQPVGSSGNFVTNSSFITGVVGAAKGVLNGFVPLNIGEWLGIYDKYMGFKFKSGANTYYGWARFDIAADGTSFTIKDYAYNSLPGTTILTGEGGATGFIENEIDKLSIQVIDNIGTVNLNNAKLKNGSLVITNIMGQIIDNKNITENITQFSTENLVTGIYLVSLKFDEGEISKKLFIR